MKEGKAVPGAWRSGMKFLLLSLLAAIPSVGICYILLRINIFREYDFLLYLSILISYCLIFFILARIFKLR